MLLTIKAFFEELNINKIDLPSRGGGGGGAIDVDKINLMSLKTNNTNLENDPEKHANTRRSCKSSLKKEALLLILSIIKKKILDLRSVITKIQN